MTPEQRDTIWGLIWDYESKDFEDDERGVVGDKLDAELSHYVRVHEPTQVSERRCGGCVHREPCEYQYKKEVPSFASICTDYSDGALPEGIAAVVRAATELLRLRKLHDAPVQKWPSGKSLESADRAFESCVDALSAAELAMAGVKGGGHG